MDSNDGDNWGADGLQALKLRLALSPDEQTLVADFAPSFVYPIFGQEETIFGYRSLEIQLRFASGSLAQYLHVEYAAKFPETSSVAADDPEKILFEFIPPSYAKSLPEFIKTVEADADAFVPIGTKVGAYRLKEKKESKGKGKGKGPVLPERGWELLGEEDEGDEDEVLFEAFAANWDTKGFKEYHRRMQIFVLLYIEGAQYIDEDDSRWEFITLFERRESGGRTTHHFIGFVSFYSFFCWPDTKRLRLAQFVVLPPYQGQGHGSALYSLSYQNILNRPEISELTVEDPSETFEDMRDKCDLYTLLSSGDLSSLSLPLNKSLTEPIRKKWKLADRQFYRLVEMVLLLSLDLSSPAASKAFRLTVKRRLYLFNREMLAQIEDAERKDKLQETFVGVEQDYRRLVEGFRG